MKLKHPRRTAARTSQACAAAVTLSIALTACAGSAGGGDDDASGGGEGYAAGASQAEIDEALADLDPVTLTFQPSAASEQSIQSPSGTEFATALEERSGGKITVETVWGQAIAGYTEVHDALADGRIDLAYTLPVYEPTEFPAVNAVGDALAGISPSPFVGEMIANAVAADVSWDTPEVVEEYESKGLHPLVPVVASGGYYSVCSDTGVAADDWDGRQVRIASKTQGELMSHLGASPVSMEYTETYEALQRGTVDCTLAQLVPSAESGIFEVAPNVGYMTTTSFTRAPGAMVAGSSFEELPLAYQQVIFDTYVDYFQGQMMTTVGGNAEAIKQAKAAGGAIEQFPEDVQTSIEEFNTEKNEEIAASGVAGDDLTDKIAESVEKWTAEAESLGYADAGTTADFDQWYDPKTDYRPLAEALYADAFEEHRPS
ncbi:TRAP transporter substrate-binding protein DctP [Nocardioides insulae]|uniref:TRAP transporter substrate-binding protein DctP n=1 Tax=Nocardioides insulae TaxID=394734 RepID=UPI0003F92D6F|nr:TRAP transporter substrate-binding protein DctP [Nocardioides insulae]